MFQFLENGESGSPGLHVMQSVGERRSEEEPAMILLQLMAEITVQEISCMSMSVCHATETKTVQVKDL